MVDDKKKKRKILGQAHKILAENIQVECDQRWTFWRSLHTETQVYMIYHCDKRDDFRWDYHGLGRLTVCGGGTLHITEKTIKKEMCLDIFF